jgi:hypothetical protein
METPQTRPGGGARRRSRRRAGTAIAAVAAAGAAPPVGLAWAQTPTPPPRKGITPGPPPRGPNIRPPDPPKPAAALAPSSAETRTSAPRPAGVERRARPEEAERQGRPGARRSEADATRGQKVRLGPQGRAVQLPPDAYLAGTGRALLLPQDVSKAPDTETTIIRRGQSWASVGTNTGQIVHVHEAPGEPGTFDFLREALGR